MWKHREYKTPSHDYHTKVCYGKPVKGMLDVMLRVGQEKEAVMFCYFIPSQSLWCNIVKSEWLLKKTNIYIILLLLVKQIETFFFFFYSCFVAMQESMQSYVQDR